MYTVSCLDGTFESIEEARKGYESAGSPRERGSSVWITEHKLIDGYWETIRTITISL